MESIGIEQFIERFEFKWDEDLIHNGELSLVYKACDREKDHQVALKMLKPGLPKDRLPPLRKIRKTFRFHHSHLVEYYDYISVLPGQLQGEPYDIKHGGFDVIVMDYMPEGSLSDLTSKVDLSTAAKLSIVEGMFNALGALHDKKQLHGNLKPTNVLVQDIGHYHIRLSDYGLISELEYAKASRSYPTEAIAYLSPEQISPDEYAYRGRVRLNSDFWQFGLIAYELLTGKYPFKKDVPSSTLLTSILKAKLDLNVPGIPAQYRELLRACLIRDASQRPQRIDQLRRILEGNMMWREGRLVKVPPPPPEPVQAPPKVTCKNCGQQNKADSSICAYCKKAISNVGSLGSFRYPGKIGGAIAILFTLFLLPFIFFYVGRIAGVLPEIFHLSDQFPRGGIVPEVNEFTQEGMAALFIFLGTTAFVSMVLSLVWYVRLQSNLSAMGIVGRRFESFLIILALILYFCSGLIASGFDPKVQLFLGPAISLASSIVLLLGFQEVWKASSPSYLTADATWRKSSSSAVIFFLWLGINLLPVLLVLPLIPFAEGASNGLSLIVGTATLIIFWLVLLIQIFRINRRQVAKYRAMARKAAE